MHRVQPNKQFFLGDPVFENTSESIIVINNQQQIIAANTAAANLLGYEKETLLAMHYPNLFRHPRPQMEFQDFLLRLNKLKHSKTFSDFYYAQKRDGNIFPVQFSVRVIVDEETKMTSHFIISFTDASIKPNATPSHHNDITQLPNIYALRGMLDKYYKAQTPIAVLAINLGHFNYIYSSHSYTISDAFLHKASQRIQAVLPANAFVAHISPERFIVVLTNSVKEHRLKNMAERLLDMFSFPFVFDDANTIDCEINIGIATSKDSTTAEKLREHVYTAVIASENEGSNCYAFYNQAYSHNIRRNLMVQDAIKRGIEENNFYLLYQPKISIPDEKLDSFEALIRLEDPILGTIYPDEFIQVAEEKGLIHKIDMWVAKEACRQGKQWLDMGKHFERIAINISPKEFRYHYFVSEISQILEDSGLPAHYLEVEITETMTMKNPEKVSIMLHQLQELGVYISIDDFGSGYSSYAYLSDLPVNCIKIDKTFSDSIEYDEKIYKIYRSIIALAQAIDAKVVAEGIENRDQVTILSKLGCDLIQGYFYSRPQHPADLEPFFDHEFKKALNVCPLKVVPLKAV